jgi:octopine/nopaline transport system substrate-binding protein
LTIRLKVERLDKISPWLEQRWTASLDGSHRMRAFLAAVWIALAAPLGLAAEPSTIRIGVDGLYPPWNATDDDGEFIGFEIDLAEDLCRRMNVECAFVGQPWDGLLPALTTGKYDAVMAGLKITEERRRIIAFSECYAADPAAFAVKADHALAATIAPAGRIDLADWSEDAKAAVNALRQALAGAALGVQVASGHADFARRYLSDLVDMRYYDALDSLALDLDAGRIDAGLSSRAFWRRASAGENGVDLALIGPDMLGGPFGEGVGVGFRQEDDQLRARFNEAIAAAIDDGAVAGLAKRWFGYDLSC